MLFNLQLSKSSPSLLDIHSTDLLSPGLRYKTFYKHVHWHLPLCDKKDRFIFQWYIKTEAAIFRRPAKTKFNRFAIFHFIQSTDCVPAVMNFTRNNCIYRYHCNHNMAACKQRTSKTVVYFMQNIFLIS